MSHVLDRAIWHLDELIEKDDRAAEMKRELESFKVAVEVLRAERCFQRRASASTSPPHVCEIIDDPAGSDTKHGDDPDVRVWLEGIRRRTAWWTKMG